MNNLKKLISLLIVAVMISTMMISAAAAESIPGSGYDENAYIKIGDYNDEVIALHTKLGELGYYYLRPESPWSIWSVKALKILEENLGIEPVDGIVSDKAEYDQLMSVENVIGKNLLYAYETNMMARGYAVENASNMYDNQITLHFDNRDVDPNEFKDLVNWNNLFIQPSTDYTLSFYAKGFGCIRSFLWPDTVERGESSQGNETSYPDGNIITTLSEDWQKVTITWKTMNGLEDTKNMLPARVYGGNEVWISQIKLETGSKATEWTAE